MKQNMKKQQKRPNNLTFNLYLMGKWPKLLTTTNKTEAEVFGVDGALTFCHFLSYLV